MATNRVIISKEKLDNLANAINTKAETSGAKTLDELILEVDNFQGGIDTTDATATSSDILLGKTAYVNEVKVEGTIETYDGSSEGGMFDDTIDKIIDGTIAELKSNVTVVRDYAFYYCQKLKMANLPNISKVGSNVFINCSALEEVNIPNCRSIGSSGFMNCEKITSLKLPKCESLGYSTFAGCKNLVDLYLGYEGVVTLLSSSAINFGTNNTRVHVRSEYAKKYATATNWASAITNGKVTIVGDYSE